MAFTKITAAGKFGEDAKTGEWFVGITSVKTANPKPSQTVYKLTNRT